MNMGNFKFFRKACSCALMAAFTVALGSVASAQVIDVFSGDLSAYTLTRILDANGGANNSGVNFEIVGGELGFTTATFDGIEQYAFIRDGLTLSVGQELQVDISGNRGGSQDIGLYVGGLSPTTDVRQEYVNVYYRYTNDNILTRGFDGTTEFSSAGTSAGLQPDATSLFIARTAVDEYELGFNSPADGRSIIQTRSGLTGNDASFVGLYADVRAFGTVGFVDNLRVVGVPEPTGFALISLASIVGLARRRRS